jgi:hypothetical protein
MTLLVLASGIALLLGPFSWRSNLLFIHRPRFVVSCRIRGVHALGHVVGTPELAPSDWLDRTRRRVDGAGVRSWTVAARLALGLVLAFAVMPRVGLWLKAVPLRFN